MASQPVTSLDCLVGTFYVVGNLVYRVTAYEVVGGEDGDTPTITLKLKLVRRCSS